MSLDFRLRNITDYKTVCYREDGTMNRITECLIWATMNVGINTITKDNVNLFFSRLQITELVYGKSVMHGETKESLLTYDVITAHIGLSTNATELSKRAFKEKMFGALERYGDELLKYELKDQEKRNLSFDDVTKLNNEKNAKLERNDPPSALELKRTENRYQFPLDKIAYTARRRSAPPQPRPIRRDPPQIRGPRTVKSAALFTARVPSDIGSSCGDREPKKSLQKPRPRAVGTSAWAMFFTNNHVKNDMNVSRETMPNYCAIKKVLVNCLKNVHIMLVY
jgi:hypothetical protein